MWGSVIHKLSFPFVVSLPVGAKQLFLFLPAQKFAFIPIRYLVNKLNDKRDSDTRMKCMIFYIPSYQSVFFSVRTLMINLTT